MNEFYPDLVRAIIVLRQQEDKKTSFDRFALEPGTQKGLGFRS